jgi:hypothetical protein
VQTRFFQRGMTLRVNLMGTKHIKTVVRDGIDEAHLMNHLVYIIEGERFHDQFPSER